METIALGMCTTLDTSTGLESDVKTTKNIDKTTSSEYGTGGDRNPPDNGDQSTGSPPDENPEIDLTKTDEWAWIVELSALLERLLTYGGTLGEEDLQRLRELQARLEALEGENLDDRSGYYVSQALWWIQTVIIDVEKSMDGSGDSSDGPPPSRRPSQTSAVGGGASDEERTTFENEQRGISGQDSSSNGSSSSQPTLRPGRDSLGVAIIKTLTGYDILDGFTDKIVEYTFKTDCTGKRIGLVGGTAAALGDHVGVRNIGDGIEGLGGPDKTTAALQLGTGLLQYAGSCAAASGIAGGFNNTIGRTGKTLASGQCFVAGTLILVLTSECAPEQAHTALVRGAKPDDLCEPRPIEIIKPGDWVLSRMDGQPDAPLVFRQVEKTFITTADALVDVSVVNTRSSASGTIRATTGHPFWVIDTNGSPAPIADAGSPHFAKTVTYATDSSGNTVHANQGWVFATDLNTGYTLSSATTANPVETAHVCGFECRATKVYNFRVSETHTYFVTPTGTLDTATWVHNQNAGKAPDPGKITGHTNHGLHQVIGRDGGRGVHPKAILDAVTNPNKVVTQSNGTIQYKGANATVVLNGDGKVVTAWGTPRNPSP
ncbi:MAG: hypothetical protein IT464_10295 [Planctomycetes bacterium]|nr:hypothetical protein [Planctomycetota bacterium]